MCTNLILVAAFVLHVVVAVVLPSRLQEGLDALPSLCQSALNISGVPGLSVVVVYNGEIRFSGGFGVKQVGKGEAVTADTVFQLASLSKPISSTIVAAIVSEGLVTWNSNTNMPRVVASYADAYVTSELRLSDGFSHRSGLYGTAGDDLELLGYGRDDILERVKALPSSGPFRITYSYSNYGLTIAAVSAASAAGKTWEVAAEDYLYQPLGMSVTSSRYSDFVSRSDRSSLHMPALNNTKERWVTAPDRIPDAQAPAGGVSSSANDLAKWLQLHLNLGSTGVTQLISQDALNETLVPQIVRGITPITNHTGFYALGWDIDYEDGECWQSHAGAFTAGARTLVKMNVDEHIGILILANAFPTGIPEGIADTFFDMVFYGESRRDYMKLWNEAYSTFNQPPSPYLGGKPDNIEQSLLTESYVGQFHNEYTGIVDISAGSDEGDLTLSFPGSSNSTFTLKHWSRDTFYMSELADDAGAGVTFAIGLDGIATSLTIDYLVTGGKVLLRTQPGQIQ